MSTTMTVNALKTIIAQLQTQLQGINGEGDYNLSILTENVILGFQTVDQSSSLPIILIHRVQCELTQMDQQSFMALAVIEILGYCKSDGVDNEFDYVMKFTSDIERAIASDETLGGYAYNPIPLFDSYVDQDSGIGVVDLKLTLSFDVIKS
jgi:hypothetical protein